MSVSAPPMIEISGPPEARGRQYGAAADTRIRRGAAFYQSLLEQRGLKWGAVMDTTRLLLGRMAELSPVQHAEVHAIAAGAGLDPAEVLLINARSEVLNAGTVAVPAAERSELDDGCTAAAVLPGRSANGRLIHGQNWDWRPECGEVAVVLVVRRADGPDLMTYVEAGGLARAGMNANGIAITGNNLSTDDESWSAPGIALSVVRRLALEAETYAEALNAVARTPRSISNNMMLSCAGPEGDAINLETTPGEVFWVLPEDGIVTHANHFVSPAARAKLRDGGVVEGMDSLYRDRRVRARLEKDGSAITLDSFKSAFEDRFGHPRAVLRTPDMTRTNRISATVASIIMDAEAGEMHVRQLPYENEEYVTYRL
ncbi:C45 family peptidase [Oceanicella sp. SM1341]|uniref:C45 family autoproteolytic acyltransferase/hydolase n=1 Tax=Oceanicella sp. SM1341 TaxID=1548889 RepID=UPI000E518EB6|nr:C45 family peptidase [Oceanicella sp. SM1341]